jgi:hypothetical protein
LPSFFIGEAQHLWIQVFLFGESPEECPKDTQNQPVGGSRAAFVRDNKQVKPWPSRHSRTLIGCSEEN